MWGYQEHYRICVQHLMRDVFKKLGADVDAEVVVIGALAPYCDNSNKVCIEPEDGKWRLELFSGLIDAIESAYINHPRQAMFYGDEASMKDKPEWIRRDSVRSSVKNALDIFDLANEATSFVGSVRQINDYYAAVVIQIPNASFAQFATLPDMPTTDPSKPRGSRSLVHSAIEAVLTEATQLLEKPDPGRSLGGSMRTPDEIIKIAAKDFLHTPGLSIENTYIPVDLFNSLNLSSSLMYEGAKSIGQLIIANPLNDDIEYLVKFTQPVPFNNSRWVRKILEMSRNNVGIIADSQNIYGLGQVKSSHDFSKQDIFGVNFLDHYYWEFACGNQALMRSQYAIPKLPQKPFEKNVFLANFMRTFSGVSFSDAVQLWNLMEIQLNLTHGSMIVVAEDAKQEAGRLMNQGTNISPILLSETLLRSASCIDGSILIDPFGICYAIGVILDGDANSECAPSRGSRYNSAVRYVGGITNKRLAIVVSDDKTVDLIPPLRKLISRKLLGDHINAFETSTPDNFHAHRNWLDNHRFYINQEQCDRLNVAIKRIEDLQNASKSMSIRIQTSFFYPDPKMNKSYFIEEFQCILE